MRAVATPVLAVASLAFLAACGGGGGDNPVCCAAQNQFSASVSGSMTKSMSGNAGFLVSSNIFSIALQNAANDGTYIQLSRAGGVPATGTYTVKGSDAQSGDFVAIFAGGGTNNFAATSGSVTITTAAADHVVGTFTFSGTGGSSGTATVSVSGQFDAKRLTSP
jgi:hypothetical protein